MSDGNFRWWHSEDQETWRPFPTRADAIQDARKTYCGGAFVICEADQETLTDDIFDADDVFDMFETHNEEVLNPEDLRDKDIPREACAELSAALRDAFAAWRQKHDPWSAWAMANMRNEEHFPAEDSAP